jgi:HemY protein
LHAVTFNKQSLCQFQKTHGVVASSSIFRLLSKTVALPGRVSAYRERRRRDKASRTLKDALRTYLEGRYANALKLAEKAFKGSEERGVAALMAARAAHQLRDEDRYRIWLGRAAESDEEVRMARLMTEAEMAVDGRRFDEAAERLALVQSGGPRQIAALRLSLRVAQAQDDWEGVLRLARQLRKHKALNAEQAEPLIRRAHLAWLTRHDDDGRPSLPYRPPPDS